MDLDGDPKLADPSDIHDYGPLSDPAWKGFEKEAYLHYEANWMLIADNLADFSHLAFVHTNTLGGSEDYALHNPSRGGKIRGWIQVGQVE